MSFLEPSQQQMKELQKITEQCPLVMVNLLKFKPDGGAESYRIYGELFTKIMEPLGVEVVYRGDCKMTAIGDEDWDEVVVVRYPSREVFAVMASSEEYHEATKYRLEALADSRLYITKALDE
jgi:uncharacterized protein (DUF1330 family)